MKEYLKSISRQLKNHSKSLDRMSILIDKPWAMIDGELAMQKLIFKKNKELILSRNGKVQEGRWDYFPEAKSLLIDRGTDKILCNEAFIDEGVLILKLDGTENQFFALANENVLPDLDVIRYLSEYEKPKQKVIESHVSRDKNLEKILENGKVIEIRPNDGMGAIYPHIGASVFYQNEPLEDGYHSLKNVQAAFLVYDSIIENVFVESHISFNGREYKILKHDYKLKKGDLVFSGNSKVASQKIKISNSTTIVVEDGLIVDIIFRNPIKHFFSHI